MEFVCVRICRLLYFFSFGVRIFELAVIENVSSVFLFVGALWILLLNVIEIVI